MTKRMPFLFFGFLAVLALATPSARADNLTLSLTPESALLTPGGLLTVDALLSNGGQTSVLLDSASGIITEPDFLNITLDDSSFLNNLPAQLDPGGAYSDQLFLSALPVTLLGNYQVQYEVLGHTDPANPATSQVVGLGTADFAVGSITPPAVPEDSSLSLLCGGALLCLVLRRRRPCVS